MSRIAVIGAGAWGTALTISLARRSGHRLSLWAHSPDHAIQLADTGENTRYLPGFILPADVEVTHDLNFAISGADIILCVTPSQPLRSVMMQIAPFIPARRARLSAARA